MPPWESPGGPSSIMSRRWRFPGRSAIIGRKAKTWATWGWPIENLGEPRRAIEYYEQVLNITREIGDRRGKGYSSFNMSLACEKLGERDRAITRGRGGPADF